MFPLIEDGDTHVLYENCALAIVIHERAMCPCIKFEKEYNDFDWVYCSIYKHVDGYQISYEGRWEREKIIQYKNPEQVNELLGINKFEEWMLPYFEGILVSRRLRGIGWR
jgi:hypothetical protein